MTRPVSDAELIAFCEEQLEALGAVGSSYGRYFAALRSRLEALQRVEQLAETWTDPAFWKADGNTFDSMDCGKDLKIALKESI